MQLSGVKMQWTKPPNPQQQEETAAGCCSAVFTLEKLQTQMYILFNQEFSQKIGKL